jgi:hypothetical protein
MLLTSSQIGVLGTGGNAQCPNEIADRMEKMRYNFAANAWSPISILDSVLKRGPKSPIFEVRCERVLWKTQNLEMKPNFNS